MNIKTKFGIGDTVYWSDPNGRTLRTGKVTGLYIASGVTTYEVITAGFKFHFERGWCMGALTDESFRLPETELFKSETLLRTRGKRLILEHELAWYERSLEELKKLVEKHKKDKASLLYDLKLLEQQIKVEEDSLAKDWTQIQELKRKLKRLVKEKENEH